MIDVGGPSMLRAAAKNFAHVAPVCRPERYGASWPSCASRRISLETRRALAAEAFSITAAYEARSRAGSPTTSLPGDAERVLREGARPVYGENPHQRAAYYAEVGARSTSSPRFSSFTAASSRSSICYDLNAAACSLREFEHPACVIVKHANPCGVAVAGSIEEALRPGARRDPLSAFGMVCVLNRPVGAELGERSPTRFVDVMLRARLRRGRARSAPRKAEHADPASTATARFDFGGQTSSGATAASSSRTATGTPGARDDGARLRRRSDRRLGRSPLRLAVCKHVTSNAIVIAKDLQTLGSAPASRAARRGRIAVEKAGEQGHDLDRRRSRVGRVLPLRGRAAARSRGRRERRHPARRVEA